jgi:hypothetical protein
MKNYGIFIPEKSQGRSPCNVAKKDLVKAMLTNK